MPLSELDPAVPPLILKLSSAAQAKQLPVQYLIATINSEEMGLHALAATGLHTVDFLC